MKEFIKQVHHKEFVVVVDDGFFSTVMKYFNLIKFSLVVSKRHPEHKCPQLHVSSGCQSTCLV